MQKTQQRQETWVQSLGQDPLEEEMATHSSFLPEKFLDKRNLLGYSPMESQRVRDNWATEHVSNMLRNEARQKSTQYMTDSVCIKLQKMEVKHRWVIPWGWGRTGGRDYKGEMKFWGMKDMFTILIVVMVPWSLHISQFIKLCILNMYSSVYVNITLIKLFLKKKQLHSWAYTQRHLNSKRYIHPNVHCSIIYNSKHIEAT